MLKFSGEGLPAACANDIVGASSAAIRMLTPHEAKTFWISDLIRRATSHPKVLYKKVTDLLA
jgi:hypothetical protein